jgi:PAS domain S-box-containing protein
MADSLDSSDQRLREHLEHGPLALIEWDENFRIMTWSKRAEKMFGWSASEVLGLHPSEFSFVYEEDSRHVGEVIEKLQAGEWQSRTEHNRNYTKDGRVIECAWYNSIQVDEQGKTRSVASLVLDETEANQTARDLKIQSERLTMALDSSRSGIWDWDLQTGTIALLGWSERLLGFHEGAFDGTLESAFQKVHPDDVAKTQAMMEWVLKEKRHFNHEVRVIPFPGSTRWISCRGKPILDSAGEPVRISGVLTDITDRKQTEESLRGSKRAAEAASSFKSAFLANMSHEIRTPLGVILGFAELLSDPDLQSVDRIEYMEVINRNGQHLSCLIDDILDLSKVEAGKLDVQKSAVNIRELLGETMAPLQGKAFEKGVALNLEISDAVPELVEVDPVRLKQIITNVVGNALKFTARGEVCLSVAVDGRGEAESGGEEMLCVRVRDTGFGMTPEGIQGLFEPFSQGDRSLSRGFGGTGLGLALSRRLARSMGGDLNLLHSAPGKGSVFQLKVPAKASMEVAQGIRMQLDPEPESFAELGKSKRPLEGMKILLAEDAPDNQILMSRMLGKSGASLEIACNGEEAVAKAEAGEFDLILMDIQMPKMDGYEAVRSLREKSFAAPIVALTAHAMKGERQKCLEAGCDEYLSKPVNSQDLTDMILKLVGARAMITSYSEA